MASAVSMPLAPNLDLLAGSVAPGMTLCSAPVPMAFSQVLDPNHAIRHWLNTALPLVVAPWVAEAVPVIPVVIPVAAEVALVVTLGLRVQGHRGKDTRQNPS